MANSAIKNQLSVAVIVRDAAESLRLTLASVREVADEIVVVDTGSTDKSKEVAREFAARVFDFDWDDDFSAARNAAWDQLTGDWVLWLDAGETLSEANATALGEFVSTSADRGCAYMLLVRVPPVDDQAALEQIGQIRLLPNHPAIRYAGRVRESCSSALGILQMITVATPFVVERGPREHDPRIKKQRAQRNVRLAEREQRDQGFSAGLLNCLGDALQTLGQPERARECFRQALAITQQGSPEQLEAYYGLLTVPEADTLDVAGQPSTESASEAAAAKVVEARSADALSLCMRAMEAFPLDAQLLCFLASCLHSRGQTTLAQQAYRMAYQFGQVQPTVWHVAEIREVAATCYSLSLQVQQKPDEAIRFLEEALKERPESIKLRRHLIDVYINNGNRDAALSHVTELPRTFPQKDAFRSAVRGACYAAQKNWLAAKAYLETAYGHGSRDPLCLKWLATALLVGGHIEAARPILEQWSTAEPRNPEPVRVLKTISEQQTSASTARDIRIDPPGNALSGKAIALNFGAASPINTRKE